MKLALLLLLAACTSNPQGIADANPGTCQVPSELGTPTATEQHAEAQDAYLGLVGALADTQTELARPDVFSLELYDGSGVFADDPIAPGTYTVEDQYRTCGLCVLIYGDYDDGSLGQAMLATSGTVTITAADDRLSGTLSDAELHQVTIDDDLSSRAVMGGCVTTVTSLAFDAEIAR